MTKAQILKRLINSSGGKICSVIFVKMDGTIRKMNFRLSVKKNLKHKGLKYNPSSVGNMVVYDMGVDGYRTIKLNNVMSLKVNGVTYNFGDR